jgi:Terminase large subunit, T4likevirus-type, N-terminal
VWVMVELREDIRLALDRVAFAEALGIRPDVWQEDLLRSHSERVLLNCSRQSGKSTMAAIIALHTALYHPGSLILCLAPALRQSQELFAKIAGYYRDLGRPVSPVGERRLSLELQNGSRIITLPGTEKTVRGFAGASLLVLDEAARIEDELFYSTRPMLAVSGGRLIMMSTPYGQRGVFHEEWIGGSGEWQRFRVSADQVPRISPEFLSEERRALGSRWYEQEYMCVFGELEGAIFSREAIDRMFDTEYKLLFDPAEAEVVE